MREFRVLFWDFDGVIKDSVAAKTRAFERLFADYGNVTAQRVRRHHEANGGLSRYEKIPLYLGWAGESVTEAKVREFCGRFSAYVMQAVIDSPWVPGVREYLDANWTRQRFVLLTGTPQEEIQQILHALALAECFREVHGAPIPKAGAIADVLRRFSCAPDQALVIGDSVIDLDAAEANHVPFLLRRTVHNQPLQERYAGPVFDNLSSCAVNRDG